MLSKFNHYLLSKEISFFPKVTTFLLNYFSEPLRTIKILMGNEDFSFPGTSVPQRFLVNKPTLVHAHNLFPGFFDFRSLELISKKYPTLLTAHDCWLMTGHCAHFFDCGKYKSGCGDCPDLSIAPSIRRDRTKANLEHKKKILSRSNIYLATPCQWLKTKFLESQIGDTFREIRVIENGINTEKFFPKDDKKSLRLEYHLDPSSLIFSFVGNKTKDNPWKNFRLMYETLEELANKLQRKVIFLCIGEEAEPIFASSYFECLFIRHTNETAKLNDLYNCSDFYLHLAKADTFPNTILEAQSCGIPVFANPVCGIPEQIINEKTGWLLRAFSPHKIADEIISKIYSHDFRIMSSNCREHILKNFSSKKMLLSYMEYYQEILANNKLTH